MGSLSHGFRRGHSIVTNARPHHGRRFVLNLDLKDFFPSFNFGRVRGFFIKSKAFELNEKVATLIAQIACYQNALPQGSPCSPVISDLLAHLLDVRLAKLAKKERVTYSRYADDLTFSTNQKSFPSALAVQNPEDAELWGLGEELVNRITDAGFAVNPDKTRMQLRTSRQLVTSLTVNAKVNVRKEYYKRTRAMCDALFKTGQYDDVPFNRVASRRRSGPPARRRNAARGAWRPRQGRGLLRWVPSVAPSPHPLCERHDRHHVKRSKNARNRRRSGSSVTASYSTGISSRWTTRSS